MNKTFGVIGGDRRQAELARLLAEEGRTVWTSGVAGCPDLPAQAAAADVVILPLPLCREDGILNSETEDLPTSALFRRFSPGQLLLAGQVRPAQQIEAENCGLTLVDYFQREELTVANAAATAESALQIAMEHLDRTLLGMECLVLGFGRIGKLLAYRLHGLGAHVTVTARKPSDLAWIRAYGWQALETGRLDGALCDFGAVFNTVPSPVLGHLLLAQLPKGCLCVELASVQGIDLAAAEELGLPHVWARSLPGRMVPAAAAVALRDAVDYILKERGDPV